MTTMKTGCWRGTAIDSEGTRKRITLTNVSYIPDLMVNLFSLTAIMEKNFHVDGTNKGIKIQKGDWTMLFNTRIGTPKGHVYASTMIPENENDFESANVIIGHEDAHQLLGHPGRNKLFGTSESLKWNLSNQVLNQCEDCLKGKANRMRLNQEATAGERLMIDISSVKSKEKKKVGKYWLLVIDKATNMKWSFFLSTKSEQVPLLIGFIKTLNEQGKEVKFIRCDNAGENESLKKKIETEDLNVKSEFTARKTPQQNGKVERAFATLYGQMRSMMSAAKWNDERKHRLWMEAAATATKLDSIMNKRGEHSPHLRFYDESPAFEKHLKIFGQVGVVTLKPGRSIKAKLEDCGIIVSGLCGKSCR